MRQQTLNFLFQQTAKAKGSDVMFADEGEQCTGEQALASVQTLAQSLSALGLETGQRVAFLCDSSVRHVLSFFACQQLGLVPCVLHARSTIANLVRALDWLEAKVLIVDSNYEKQTLQVLEEYDVEIPLVVQDGKNAAPGYGNYQQLPNSGPAGIGLPELDITAPAMIILSSGTTGDPKGIVHSQKTLYESAMAGEQVFGGISSNDSVLVAMAPSFAAWNHVCFPYLAHGARLVFNRGFEAERYVSSMQNEAITHAALVPTAWRRALAAIKPDTDLSALKLLFFSGEPGTKDFISSVKQKLPKVNIRSAYLSSEGGDASACVADHELLSREKLCIGKAIKGASIRIIDPEGSIEDELAVGETGEIAVSSNSLALGYWKNDTLTEERFIEGWWRSGDLGYLDEEGNLTIGGRNDNMIISGGLKVHAEEIEAALMQHPAVSLAAVVGKADTEWGQRIEAYVVCDENIDTQSINEWCRKQELLPAFKLPKQIHKRDSLPTGATGKIYRRGLLEEAALS